MSATMFSKIDVAEAVRDLPRLLERVAAGTGRVEVAAAGQSVVLISRHELDTLEHSLALLADAEAVKAMRDAIQRVAHAVAAPAAVAVA